MIEPFIALGAGLYAAAAISLVWVAAIDASTPDTVPSTFDTRHAARLAAARRPAAPIDGWLADELLLEAAVQGISRCLTGLFAPPTPSTWLAWQLGRWQTGMRDRAGQVVELAPFRPPPPPPAPFTTGLGQLRLDLEAVA